MLIVCPSCATSYDVEAASLQPNGRQVRCVRCRTVWRAEPRKADLLVAAAEALAPDRADAAPQIAPDAIPTAMEAAEADFSAAEVDAGPDPWSVALQGVGPEPEPAGLAAEAELAPSFGGEDGEISAAPEADAPPMAPVDLDAGRPPIDIVNAYAASGFNAHADIETLAARRARRSAKRKRQGWPLSPMQTVIMCLLVIDAFLVAWRKDIVRALPQTASFYSMFGLSVNLRGLAFEDFSTTTEHHEGVPILVVQGMIVNDSGAVAGLPRLKLAVRNAGKQELYSWTAAPPRAALSPGQSVPFHTRLASPPPETHDVLVRFISRGDVMSEAR